MPTSQGQPRIRKAVIPVAGFGTRFLPATKAMPKEMLPIVDKPVIQYIVEEAAAAGIDEVIFVTGRGKRTLEDHFDTNVELEQLLRKTGKTAALHEVRAIAKLVRVVYVRQHQPLGLGHAILQAEQVVGHEPFVVLLGDDVIDARVPATAQLERVYQRQHRSVVAVRRCPREELSRYGVVDAGPLKQRVGRVKRIVEKPTPDRAPSDLAITGRYLLDPAVFGYLHRVRPGANGEIQFTDALQLLAKHEGLLAYEYEGRYYDGGNKLELIKATVDFALKRPEFHDELLAFLVTRTR